MVSWQKGLGQPLSIHHLNVEDLVDVDGAKHTLNAQGDVFISGIGLACGGGRIRVEPAGDVEGVEAETEVVSVDSLDDLPALLPQVVVRAPAETLVCEVDIAGKMLVMM